jgi:hypothetical protein
MILGGAFLYWQDTIDEFFQKLSVNSEQIANSETSLCYRLPSQEWLEFSLPLWTDQLKILSNAELLQYSPTKDVQYHYALDYQVLNDQGQTVHSGVYHHRTEMTPYLIPGKDKTTSLHYYTKSRLIPADGKQLKINLRSVRSQGNISRLRLKLHSADPAIASVVVRVYFPEYSFEPEISYLWDRLPPRTRQRLAEGNVYPKEFLSKQEQKNLVRELWRPIAPNGVQGQDYQLQRLYRLQAEKAIPQRKDPIIPKGLVIAPGHRATIPVPQEGRSLQLKIQRLDIPNKEPFHFGMNWYGKEINESRQHVLTISKPLKKYQDHFSGGLIELWSDTKVNVKIYAIQDDTKIEIEPISLYLRTYQATIERPVVYSINHIQRQKTPLKVDFRILSSDNGNATARVEYQFKDTSGKGTNGSLHLQAPTSLYDRLPKKKESFFVTEPVSFSFLLPANISKINFSSGENVLVTAYNRPLGLPQKTRVPEDYYAQSRHIQSQPTWFMFYPDNYKELFIHHQSVLLTLQYHPPERDPRLLKGVYKWEAFRPHGNWSGAFLFTPRDIKEPLRKKALPAAYTPLPLNQPVEVTLASPDNLKAFRPKLVYFAKTGTMKSVKVFLNGVLHFQHPLEGSRGSWTLPPVPAGKNFIRIEASFGTKVYMNHLVSKKTDHILKFANRIDTTGLSFSFYKQTSGQESLSMKLFSPYSSQKRSVFKVTIDPLHKRKKGPYNKLTMLERIFEVLPTKKGQPVPIMHSENEYLTTGQPFFFPLGDDLPSGEYRFRVDLQKGPGGYLQMYTILPGQFQQGTIKKEPILDNEIN